MIETKTEMHTHPPLWIGKSISSIFVPPLLRLNRINDHGEPNAFQVQSNVVRLAGYSYALSKCPRRHGKVPLKAGDKFNERVLHFAFILPS